MNGASFRLSMMSYRRPAFRVVGSDYAVMRLGASLCRDVFEQSPRSSLCFESWHHQTFGQLDNGRVDLVFYAFQDQGT